MLNQESIMKKVRALEIRVRGLSQQLFAGQTHSAFKGRGMSFSEVRNYQIGDDVRTIDWNVTARYQDAFVKVYEEERELTVFIVLDVSGSMYFGQNEDSKISKAIEVLATLGFSAAKKNDRIGALFISDGVEAYFPPKKGMPYVYAMIKKVIDLKHKSQNTDLKKGLNSLFNYHKKRSACFVISDFTNIETTKDSLLRIAQKHDLMCIHLSDPGEEELPNLGFVRWINAEDQSISWVDTSSSQVRKNYQAQQIATKKASKEFLQRLNIDTAFMSTQDDTFKTLKHFFEIR